MAVVSFVKRKGKKKEKKKKKKKNSNKGKGKGKRKTRRWIILYPDGYILYKSSRSLIGTR